MIPVGSSHKTSYNATWKRLLTVNLPWLDGWLHVPQDQHVYSVLFLAQLCVLSSIGKRKRPSFLTEVHKACFSVCLMLASSLIAVDTAAEKAPKSPLPYPWQTVRIAGTDSDFEFKILTMRQWILTLQEWILIMREQIVTKRSCRVIGILILTAQASILIVCPRNLIVQKLIMTIRTPILTTREWIICVSSPILTTFHRILSKWV